MASDQAPKLGGLFATAPRTKPSRTYSHKGKNSRARSLPALKPTSDTPIPANTGVRLQRFRVSKSNSWELRPISDESAVTHRADKTPAVENLHSLEVHDEAGNPNRMRAQKTSNPSATKSEESMLPVHRGTRRILSLTSTFLVTSPVSPPTFSQASLESEDGNPGAETEDDDEDDLIILSQRPLGYNPKHDRRTANGTRSLRRRPFLIFGKTESKGYKQLKSIPQTEKRPTTFRYQPGDGFSGREARPNGSNLLTRAGKQSITTFHVGVLDLTQSEPPPIKKRRGSRRASLDDNSFASVSKKKARRPLAPMDPNQQSKPATVGSDQAKKGTSAVHETRERNAAATIQGGAVAKNKETQIWDAIPKPRPLHPDTTRRNILNDDDDEVDMIVIERSDDITGNRDPTVPHQRRPPGEGQDSFGSHVSVTPPQQLRIRAQSVSPESPARRAAGNEKGVPSGRVFRRVNTQ